MTDLLPKPQGLKSLNYLLSSLKRAHRDPRLLTPYRRETSFITQSCSGFKANNKSDKRIESNMTRQNSAGARGRARRENPAVTNTLLPSPLPRLGRRPMAVTPVQRETIGVLALKRQQVPCKSITDNLRAVQFKKQEKI